MKNHITLIVTIILTLTLFLACEKNEKPVNLSVAREEVKQYYESGEFAEELNKVIEEAKLEFDKIEFNENSVVILDVDETVLDNYELAEQMGFGYVYEMNKKWNAELKAPAIQQVKELYDFLLTKGAKIIFLTGRNSPEYGVTYQNLKKEGYTIFDVDETALNNYELAEQMGFGYVYTMNKQWNAEMKAPAIQAVKELYDFLLSKGAKIIFLTGRNFPEYDVTYQNLKNEGYTIFDTLITQIGDEKKMKSQDFKTAKRVWLTEQGYEIIGTVGDQWSDLEGLYHGIQVKIPNYLYLIED